MSIVSRFDSWRKTGTYQNATGESTVGVQKGMRNEGGNGELVELLHDDRQSTPPHQVTVAMIGREIDIHDVQNSHTVESSKGLECRPVYGNVDG